MRREKREQRDQFLAAGGECWTERQERGARRDYCAGREKKWHLIRNELAWFSLSLSVFILFFSASLENGPSNGSVPVAGLCIPQLVPHFASPSYERLAVALHAGRSWRKRRTAECAARARTT